MFKIYSLSSFMPVYVMPLAVICMDIGISKPLIFATLLVIHWSAASDIFITYIFTSSFALSP
ncbi:hypothetical protein B0T17DRAFT_528970 [Bombardia bombarda]|uniref:Uncharacterized protein n=1 Tax=Bombardia bombarda TaxID=252184 RepID=A0AA40C9Q1_9PEZI|nr:hypothetical protein B0T17DRAFT_528970 [Bombardia bombarda]